MGIGWQTAELIVREHAYKKIEGIVLGIGRITIGLTPQAALEMLAKWNVIPATLDLNEIGVDNETVGGKGLGYIRDDEFFRLLGAEQYLSIDISDYEGASIIHDLNDPIPSSLENIADFIVDASTFDNIFEPAVGLKNTTRMLKPGGRIVSNSLAVNMHNPYTILAPSWFFDYYCFNNFSDVKVYFMAFIGNSMNVLTPSLPMLNRSIAGIHNPTAPPDWYALTTYLAEKGSASTWDVAPVQHHYRSDSAWKVFDRGIELIKNSGRPHITWSDTDLLMYVPPGYEALTRDQELRFRECVFGQGPRGINTRDLPPERTSGPPRDNPVPHCGLTETTSGEMGTSISEISDVLAAIAEPPSGPRRVLDIGTQNVSSCTLEEVIGFIRRFNDVWDPADLAAYAQVVAAGAACHPKYGEINGAWLGDVLSRAGFEYVAYDIVEGYRTTIFDLNTDAVPAVQRGSFDLVLNCGASAHVLNLYNVFNVMHDAVRVGGVMYYAVPMTGYLRHGYFTYTPMLFCDLARANEYEIVRMNFNGPQAWNTVSEQLVDRYPNMVRFDPSDPLRWRDIRVPDSLVCVTLRRTSSAPFRASLETTTTTAATVAKDNLDADERHDGGAPDRDAGEALKAERDALDRSTRSILDRFTDPDLTFNEILALYDAHQKVYPEVPFSPLLEKKSLELGLALFPDREDLRARLEMVEKLLVEQWPLYRFSGGAAGVDAELIAMDGIEEKLRSIPGRQVRLRHAIAAFRRYLAAGHPERFPLALEFDALRYAAEELYPDDWALRLRLGACAAQLSNSMTLRRRAE